MLLGHYYAVGHGWNLNWKPCLSIYTHYAALLADMPAGWCGQFNFKLRRYSNPKNKVWELGFKFQASCKVTGIQPRQRRPEWWLLLTPWKTGIIRGIRGVLMGGLVESHDITPFTLLDKNPSLLMHAPQMSMARTLILYMRFWYLNHPLLSILNHLGKLE